MPYVLIVIVCLLVIWFLLVTRVGKKAKIIRMISNKEYIVLLDNNKMEKVKAYYPLPYRLLGRDSCKPAERVYVWYALTKPYLFKSKAYIISK